MDATIDAGRAAALGVADALVFRRIGAHSWAHVGGLGRGKGWAGIIDIDEREDALAFHIPQAVGEVWRQEGSEPSRVLGPYYSASSAVVRISPDVAVVLGSCVDERLTDDDVALLRLAQHIDASITAVEPSKRLADELELLTAVRELMNAPVDRGLGATQQYLTDVTMRALSCDIGVARDERRALTVVGDNPISDEQWQILLDRLAADTPEGEWCAQDMTSKPAQIAAELLPQARSMLLARMPAPSIGLLLMVHTAHNPRGFSSQCRRMYRSIIDTGLVVASTAILRDQLRHAADQASAAARTDPLTGLGNRLAWDEAVGRAQEAVDAGETYSVVSLDVDGLKDINDRYGHPAGDDLLRRCAGTIREHCSEVDLAVRMGGDEFAILVPHALCREDVTYRAFVAAFDGLKSTNDAVAASLGVAVAAPGDSLFDAIREADMNMYQHKRQRRRDRADLREESEGVDQALIR